MANKFVWSGATRSTNGGFDSDTGWTKGTGWAISGGVATKTAGSASDLEQNQTVTDTVTYQTVFTVSGRTAGTIFIRLGGTSGTSRSTNATFTENIVCGAGADPKLELVADDTFDGSVDNVGVYANTGASCDDAYTSLMLLDEISSRLPEWFGRLPAARVTVERVPPFKEGGAPGAYYVPPPLDGSKPGIFYANLRSVREIPRFGMRTLAYHEAIPGHHLQIAIAQELPGLPLFRRVVPFTAYVEGWALYAERLALENGFHATPFDRLGALVAEVFRAVRLVVDTGIHAQRWSREQTIEYMLQNTGMPETAVVAEFERYIVSPGQACAY